MESAKPAGICQPTDPTLFVVAPALRYRAPLSDQDGGTIRLRDYAHRPGRVGDLVSEHRQGDHDTTVVIRDIEDQRDTRWKDIMMGTLVHVAGGLVGRDAQHDASAVLCGPSVHEPFDLQSDALTPTLGHDRDPLDQAAVSFDGMCCLVRPDVPEPLGILCVWHDARASYQAVLAPRPYKRRPEQIVRVRRGLWNRFVPAVGDLFGQQTPDHVCLHLIRRRDNPKPDLVYVPLGRSTEQILHAFDQSHDPSMSYDTDIDNGGPAA